MGLPRTPTEPTRPLAPDPRQPDDEPTRRRSEAQFRVALVVGSAVQPASELADELRKRLQFSAGLVAVFCVLQTAIYLPFDFPRLLAAPVEAFTRPPGHGGVVLIGCLEAVLAVWLSPRRPTTLARLRMMEWLVIAPVLAYSAWAEFRALADTMPQGSYPGFGFAHWALLMVGYGVVIPNTWSRCAAMVGLIVLVAFLPDVTVMLGHTVPFQPAFKHLAFKALWLGVAGLIVVYGAYRVEILRQEVLKARQLGQYVLKERLGAGGMGEVYLAEHVLLRRPCAIKLIRPEQAGDAKNLLRFEREVKTTATLTHPNTIQVFDYGHAEDGTFYYVMEYLPGLTLEQLVKRHGPLPAARAVHFLRQVCGALREAHGVGLIHRDVKPGNVMVCERGGLHDLAKLLDFGLVLATASPDREAGEKLTQEGAIPGTPAYMSPEQAAGHDNLDARSDIYSLGALAYFLLTGRSPFAGRSTVQMLAAHMYEAPAPLTNHCPDVPVELQAVVLRCLAKDPAQRFPDAQSLENALASCQTEGPWTPEQAANWWGSLSARNEK